MEAGAIVIAIVAGAVAVAREAVAAVQEAATEVTVVATAAEAADAEEGRTFPVVRSQ